MALRSMTGFARTDGAIPGYRWTWEARSVNGKGLDIRLRLPSGFDRLEIPVRDRAAKLLVRGNCALTLTLSRDAPTASLKIDAAAPTLDGILGLKGVLEMAESEEAPETREALDAAILASADATVAQLDAARAGEGAAIAEVLLGHLARIEALTAAAEACPARQPEAIRERLRRQVEDLLGAVPALDPQRLHQEAALIATKADIREELDRLKAHIGQARQMIVTGGPVGRKLDFLAQEFNRESNTLCSKSNDRELTGIGLDLKATVDQLREQIQNIE